MYRKPLFKVWLISWYRSEPESVLMCSFERSICGLQSTPITPVLSCTTSHHGERQGYGGGTHQGRDRSINVSEYHAQHSQRHENGASGENTTPISLLGQKWTVLNITHGKSHMQSSTLRGAERHFNRFVPLLYSDSVNRHAIEWSIRTVEIRQEHLKTNRHLPLPYQRVLRKNKEFELLWAGPDSPQ